MRKRNIWLFDWRDPSGRTARQSEVLLEPKTALGRQSAAEAAEYAAGRGHDRWRLNEEWEWEQPRVKLISNLNKQFKMRPNIRKKQDIVDSFINDEL